MIPERCDNSINSDMIWHTMKILERRLSLLFCICFAVFMDKHNVRTLSVKIKVIFTRSEAGQKISLSYCLVTTAYTNK